MLRRDILTFNKKFYEKQTFENGPEKNHLPQLWKWANKIFNSKRKFSP